MSLKPPLPPTGTSQTISWGDLDVRIDDLEVSDTSDETRLDALEGVDTATDTRLDAVESSDVLIREAPLAAMNPPDGMDAAVGDDTADDTDAIQALIDLAYDSGGGDVLLHPRHSFRVTQLARTWDAGVTVNLAGGGKRATILKKHGAGTVPIISFIGTPDPTSSYSTIRDLSIDGEGDHDGIKLDALARLRFSNVYITGCEKAIHNLGSLVMAFDGCTLLDNVDGLYNRASAQANATPPNLITARDTQFLSNSHLGIDHGVGQMLVIGAGCNLEDNGTSDDLATGGLCVQNTVDDPIGYAHVVVREAWFENNLGRAIQAYAGDLMLDCVNILATEDGRAVYSAGNRMLSVRNVFAPSPGDTVEATSATGYAVVEGGVIHTVTLNSAQKSQQNVQDNAAVYDGFKGLRTDGLNVGDTSATVAGGIFLNRSGGDAFIRLRRDGGGGAQVRSPGTTAAGVRFMDDGGTGGAFWESSEMTPPAAPGANAGRLFFQDNGSGKTQLAVRFPTGAVQVIATEP